MQKSVSDFNLYGTFMDVLYARKENQMHFTSRGLPHRLFSMLSYKLAVINLIKLEKLQFHRENLNPSQW